MYGNDLFDDPKKTTNMIFTFINKKWSNHDIERQKMEIPLNV